MRVEKNFLKIGHTEFCADFKNVQKSQVWQKGKNLLQKKLNF